MSNGTCEGYFSWTLNEFLIDSIVLIQGIMLVFNNFLLLSIILFHHSLRVRKEYLIIVGVAVADFIFGVSICMEIPYKFYYQYCGIALTISLTRHQCILTTHIILNIFAIGAQGQQTLVHSVDRLLALGAPIKYFKWGKKYALIISGMPYLANFIQITIFMANSLDDHSIISKKYCTNKVTLSKMSFIFWLSEHLLFGVVSVLLYLVVMFLYWRHTNKVNPMGQQVQQQQDQQRQRRLSITVGISCCLLITFFFFPAFISVIFKELDLGKYLQLLYNLNPICNLFLYVKRHKELRLGLKFMFHGQSLPLNLNLVTGQQEKTRNTQRVIRSRNSQRMASVSVV